MTSALILTPIVGALLVWLLPMERFQAGLLALAIAIGEFGVWLATAVRFDFDADPLALRSAQQFSWFSDLNVSYHVGFFGFTIWLAGLTTLVMAAAIAYGFWAGRERPRAYYGLMLFLTGAVVAVFTAQDFLLFYVAWEAMLIPLYILVGVWGGERRVNATIKFVVYTMAGSLLMLAAIIVYGLQQGTFSMIGTASNSMWLFLGFAAAFAVKAPLFPLHGWLPDAYRQSAPEVAGVLSGVISKTAAYGFFYVLILHFPVQSHDLRVPILVLATIGLIYGSLLAFRQPDFRGVVAYSSMAQMGLITIGFFAINFAGFDGALLQMVNHGLISAALFMVAGFVVHRTGTDRFALLGGMAKGRPALATLLMTTGVIALAVPGSTAFAGEFLILTGVFSAGWIWAVLGAVAIVLAAMYMLRLVSAVLHRERGTAVFDSPDLRWRELAVLVPLVATLLFLSAWPAGITDNLFGKAVREQAPPLVDALYGR